MLPRLQTWALAHAAPPTRARQLAEALEARYAEPHRHYHTLDHIHASLSMLDRLAPPDPLIEGAIWFHDVIYDPHRSDNESESARWFEEHCGDWLDPEKADRVRDLILATDPKAARGCDSLESLMIDIDLSILGSDPDRYDDYAGAIRREYAHVPEALYRSGRTAILKKFLENPIYLTPEFMNLEAAARANLAREIGRLS